MRKKIVIVLFSVVFLLTSMYVLAAKLPSKQENTSIAGSPLEVEVITGGIGIGAVIRNDGDENLTNLSWEIILNGGIVLVGKNTGGTVDLLRSGNTETIKVPFVLGFGKTTITVTINASEGNTSMKTSRARLLGFFVRLIPGDVNALTTTLNRIASGLKAPTMLTTAGDGTNRLFVADQPGKIYIIENDVLLQTPFLDLTSKMVKVNPIYDERGLLGLAFHPNYEINGRFFVYYSGTKTAEGVDHESIIAEYHVSSEDSNIADPLSEIIILRVDQPEPNHNGGQLAFGPEGYLYIGLGDGGGAGDQHGTIGNGQNNNTLLGKILRIDIDSDSPYAIPLDNPFVGTEGLDEIYAFGFRNPYRFSFDSLTGALFVADVGQDKWEEIDLVENGGNYGWRILEGTHLYDPDLAEELNISIESLQPPIYEYSHNVGRSIIGGYVYRGNQSPNLVGCYVFGDWSTDFVKPDGKIYYLTETDPGVWERQEFSFENEKPLKRFILGFGQDESGEIYVVTTRFIGSLLPTGEIWHLTAE
ncbi:MAG: PQQ-dependent sugar dehydrogenase [Candidatus Thermoplasmatota archaeon]|nr:PQQ-dependent sugar dehydrogenase [Candidatus Thermoplasmatota archaeon]